MPCFFHPRQGMAPFCLLCRATPCWLASATDPHLHSWTSSTDGTFPCTLASAPRPAAGGIRWGQQPAGTARQPLLTQRQSNYLWGLGYTVVDPRMSVGEAASRIRFQLELRAAVSEVHERGHAGTVTILVEELLLPSTLLLCHMCIPFYPLSPLVH